MKTSRLMLIVVGHVVSGERPNLLGRDWLRAAIHAHTTDNSAELQHILDTGVCRIFAPYKAKSSNQALLTYCCVRGHKIILSHLICQIRNALHFLDFSSWCKDSAIPSKHIAVCRLVVRVQAGCGLGNVNSAIE